MSAEDDARTFALTVRRLRSIGTRYAAASGSISAFEIENRIWELARVAALGQVAWVSLRDRTDVSNGQKRQILGRHFADVNADFTAQLQASRAALTSVEQAYVTGMAIVAPTGDRTWNLSTHQFDSPGISKAQRSTLDQRLTAFVAELPALLN